MNYENNTAKDVQIAYIGGGSKGWAWGLMSDLAKEPQLSGVVRLYDINDDAAKANELIGNQIKVTNPQVSPWTYKAVPSPQEALTGADFVIISILPGSFDLMAVDVHHPENYGIYQSVGDSVGPGGLIRAMRTIPMYVTIAEAIKAYAPEAWVLNYTNPMTICTRTLYKVFPEIKALGNCHEVFGTQKILAAMLDEELGIKDVSREEIKVNVTGINHFTWLTSASYKHIDLIPMYKAFSEKHHEMGFEPAGTGNWMNDHFSSANRVKFDLFQKHNIIAAAGDRHLAEFMDGKDYLKDPETAKSWKFALTPVSWRKKNEQERITMSKELVSGKKDFEIKETGEEGVKQMKALLGLEDIITNINFPNQGQIPWLPMDAVVETNALLRHNQIIPMMTEPVPQAVADRISLHVTNQENIVEAGLKSDQALAFKAFMADPLVDLDEKDAKECFDYMYANTMNR